MNNTLPVAQLAKFEDNVTTATAERSLMQDKQADAKFEQLLADSKRQQDGNARPQRQSELKPTDESSSQSVSDSKLESSEKRGERDSSEQGADDNLRQSTSTDKREARQQLDESDSKRLHSEGSDITDKGKMDHAEQGEIALDNAANKIKLDVDQLEVSELKKSDSAPDSKTQERQTPALNVKPIVNFAQTEDQNVEVANSSIERKTVPQSEDVTTAKKAETSSLLNLSKTEATIAKLEGQLTEMASDNKTQWLNSVINLVSQSKDVEPEQIVMPVKTEKLALNNEQLKDIAGQNLNSGANTKVKELQLTPEQLSQFVTEHNLASSDKSGSNNDVQKLIIAQLMAKQSSDETTTDTNKREVKVNADTKIALTTSANEVEHANKKAPNLDFAKLDLAARQAEITVTNQRAVSDAIMAGVESQKSNTSATAISQLLSGVTANKSNGDANGSSTSIMMDVKSTENIELKPEKLNEQFTLQTAKLIQPTPLPMGLGASGETNIATPDGINKVDVAGVSVEKAIAQTRLETTAQVKQDVVIRENVLFNKQELAANVQQQIGIMLSRSLKSVDIRLDPPELGSMQIKMQVNGEQASVSFVVNSQQAKDALENAMPRLREMLEQQGMMLADSDVKQGEQQASGSKDDEASNHQGHDVDSDDAEEQELATVSTQVNSPYTVDYYA